MSLSPQFLDELKHRVDLAALIGRRVKLTKRGREYQGLCPFHNEKTPSFSVVVDKGFYHCFGCGEHGSAIDFVMKTEGLSFPETVERLAQDAGMEVPRATPEEQQRQARARGLHEVMERVCGWYESELAGAGGAAAREYLLGRGLDEKTIKRFRLGYAPDRRDGVKAAMLSRGVTEADLIESGMLIAPEDGGDSFDRFRHRIMFPILDRRGRIVAFGGRAMSEKARAKYLNSPETPIFHKGHLLFNLAGASKPAYDAGNVLVVEGYMDVIGLARAGIDNAVAPLGTAVTEDQLKMLWRMAPEPTLCFDGDAAGQRAAFRAAERALPLLQAGFSLRFVELPEGEDPDSLVRRQGPAKIRELVREAAGLAEVIWLQCLAEGPVDTPERRAGLRKRLRQISQTIEDAGVRDFYYRYFKDKIDLTFGGATRGRSGERRVWVNRNRRLPAERGLNGNLNGGQRPREKTIVAMLLNSPELALDVFEELAGINMVNPDLDRIRVEILKHAGLGKALDLSALKDDLPESNLVQLIDELTGSNVERLEPFARPQAPMETVINGWTHIIRLHRLDELRQELAVAERALGEETTDKAFAHFIALQDAVRQAEAEATEVDTV